MSLIARSNLFEFDRFFNDARTQRVASSALFSPRVDISEAEKHYAITAELPGVEKDDIHVHVKDGVLTLEAQSHQEELARESDKVVRQERRYGKFMRSFQLGTEVRESDIKAAFKNGVLALEIPKAEQKEPESHRIAVH